MRVFKRTRAVAVLCLAVVAGVISHRAFADSFDIYRLYTSSGGIANIGLTDNGSLTTRAFTDIPPSDFTYTTFTPPSTTTTSPTLPALTFDNGSACSVSVAGFQIDPRFETCNNGRDVFEAYTDNSVLPSLYLLEADLPPQLLYAGPAGEILLDSMGDVAFLGERGTDDSTNYLYYDTTSRAAVTPEPSSIILLLTGGLGTAAAWRRRMRQA